MKVTKGKYAIYMLSVKPGERSRSSMMCACAQYSVCCLKVVRWSIALAYANEGELGSCGEDLCFVWLGLSRLALSIR